MSGGPARDLAYQRLGALLDRGVYPAGSRLPGERSLAGELGVSRSTLRLVLARLADEGRLAASAQRGWFVPQLVLGEPPSQLISFTELAQQRGLHASATLLGQQQRPATFDEAADLQIAAAAPLVEIVRLRRMDGVPITVETAVLPLRRVSWLPDVDLTDRSLYALLEEHDLRVHRSTYTVQAMVAGEWESAQLELPIGAAVLVARDVTYTVDRTPIIITVNRYRGDAYRFTADLFRSAG
ncbi:MAG TPA: GntR family transcriptional regulator [Microlunatus sp.]|nr:GntR family transcriptional regulator [Microlunatus sp.]